MIPEWAKVFCCQKRVTFTDLSVFIVRRANFFALSCVDRFLSPFWVGEMHPSIKQLPTVQNAFSSHFFTSPFLDINGFSVSRERRAKKTKVHAQKVFYSHVVSVVLLMIFAPSWLISPVLGIQNRFFYIF